MSSASIEKGINRYGFLENVYLTREDWAYRWGQSLTGFHQADTDPLLLKFQHLLLGEKNKIFVPLCGKTKDMLYFANKGHNVFGCEFVSKGVLDFFEENGIDYSCKKAVSPPDVKVYKAEDKRITIYLGDFFTLSSDNIGKFHAIWDCGSLVAIHPSRRRDYVRTILDLLCAACGKYLIKTISMTGVHYTGPPYSVSPKDIDELFGQFCHITELETKEEEPETLNVPTKCRHIFLLKKKIVFTKYQY